MRDYCDICLASFKLKILIRLKTILNPFEVYFLVIVVNNNYEYIDLLSNNRSLVDSHKSHILLNFLRYLRERLSLVNFVVNLIMFTFICPFSALWMHLECSVPSSYTIGFSQIIFYFFCPIMFEYMSKKIHGEDLCCVLL